jgi:hypothetical protein
MILPGGQRDDQGYALHCIYTARSNIVLEQSDDVSNAPPVYEFEAEGGTTLPFCGNIALTGGEGTWSWQVRMDDLVQVAQYRPQWRVLTQFRRSGQIITIPFGHTRLGVLTGTGTVKNTISGTTLTLSQVAAPVIPGTPYEVTGGVDLELFTKLKL